MKPNQEGVALTRRLIIKVVVEDLRLEDTVMVVIVMVTIMAMVVAAVVSLASAVWSAVLVVSSAF